MVEQQVGPAMGMPSVFNALTLAQLGRAQREGHSSRGLPPRQDNAASGSISAEPV